MAFGSSIRRARIVFNDTAFPYSNYKGPVRPTQSGPYQPFSCTQVRIKLVLVVSTATIGSHDIAVRRIVAQPQHGFDPAACVHVLTYVEPGADRTRPLALHTVP